MKERKGNSTPCYQIREQEIEFVADQLNILKEALEAEGFSTQQYGETIAFSGRQESTGRYVSGRFSGGVIYGAENLDVESLKAQYAAQQIIDKFKHLGKITKKSKTHFQVHLKQ